MEQICSGSYGLWLINALERGFQGFGNMTDEALDEELRQRGLRAEFDVPDAPVDEDDDAEFEDDDDELRDSLLAFAAENTDAYAA
jgi:hypothetical protein